MVWSIEVKTAAVATVDPDPATEVPICFVGLGNMGAPMASNLLRAGFAVTVTDLDPSKVRALADVGATPASSVAEAAAGATIVLTSLPGPTQVEQVGSELFDQLEPGALWIDLSTNDLACARRLEQWARRSGIALLDAPVTGGAEGAEAGTLSVLVGGTADAHARALPLLRAIGARHDLLGPYGAGYVAKIASVSLCYLHSVCLTEALLLGVKGGVDPAAMLDIIRHSTGRSYVADRYGPKFSMAATTTRLRSSSPSRTSGLPRRWQTPSMPSFLSPSVFSTCIDPHWIRSGAPHRT